MKPSSAQRSALNSARYEAASLITAFRQLLPDMRTILERDAVKVLDIELRQVDRDHEDERNDGDPLHDWQNQTALIDLTQKIFRVDRESAKAMVFVGTCFPRRRARCNAARALAEQLRSKGASEQRHQNDAAVQKTPRDKMSLNAGNASGRQAVSA